MIATSENVRQKLLQMTDKIHVVTIPFDEELQNHLEYSHVGYLRLMVLRTRFINMLLQSNIETFLFECDFLWLNNPLEIMFSARRTYDIIVISDTEKGEVINGGFYYLFPTQKTKTLFKRLTKMMEDFGKTIQHLNYTKPVSESKNDQAFLTHLIKNSYAAVKTLVLPFRNFPSGLWYRMSAAKTKSWKPIVIHNNWIIGNINKVKRAKSKGNWFLTDDFKCNVSKVKELMTIAI